MIRIPEELNQDEADYRRLAVPFQGPQDDTWEQESIQEEAQ